ncbi:MAG: sialate O-acetylesterase, partial [Planctomycetes bacterium]|nr:sialate O-acetylesterase [Planctomycetota bacterium]
VPSQGQVFSRDLTTNMAQVTISGIVTAPNYDRVNLVATRDGSNWSVDSEILDYSLGDPEFTLEVDIEAGLWEYEFELLLESRGATQSVELIENVVCGDVYFINGQSNAVAGDYGREGLANRDQSRWIRSFGSASLTGSDVAQDLEWHLADGLEMYQSGTVGAWGLRAAHLISGNFEIPIGILNGAVGGTSVSQHARDNSDPENLSTIYGRLLYRARKAEVDTTVRGLLWHQGESDGSTPPEDYISSWGALKNNWMQDFPSLEHIIMFQVRKGCGIPNMKIRELQRKCGDIFPDVTVIPTTGIDQHDGCHFFYEGYRTMGNWIAVAISRQFYEEWVSHNKFPPNLKEARFTSPAKNEIELIFRNRNQAIILDSGIESCFTLGPGIAENVISATSSPGKMLLQLSDSTSSTMITYRGQSGSGPWIKNSHGVGAFTFQVTISP